MVLGADVQREEKKVEKEIREAAKRNDMGSAKVLLLARKTRRAIGAGHLVLLTMIPFSGAGQGGGAVEEGGQPALREQGPAQLHLHAPRRDRR